jgi:RimJ/RimL family protein N-acetyltransferase
MNEKKPTALAGDTSTSDSHVIETARLRLRLFCPEDLDDLAAMFSDPNVMKYVEDGKPADREQARKALDSIIQHWRRHGFGRWAVEDKTTREFVGFGGLRSLFGMPEVVYYFATPHWGKGLATELGRASLRYGFETHSFARIVAIAKPGNTASIHVMEKLGMRFEKRTSYYNIEVVQYEITHENFRPDDSVYVVRE